MTKCSHLSTQLCWVDWMVVFVIAMQNLVTMYWRHSWPLIIESSSVLSAFYFIFKPPKHKSRTSSPSWHTNSSSLYFLLLYSLSWHYHVDYLVFLKSMKIFFGHISEKTLTLLNCLYLCDLYPPRSSAFQLMQKWEWSRQSLFSTCWSMKRQKSKSCDPYY